MTTSDSLIDTMKAELEKVIEQRDAALKKLRAQTQINVTLQAVMMLAGKPLPEARPLEHLEGGEVRCPFNERDCLNARKAARTADAQAKASGYLMVSLLLAYMKKHLNLSEFIIYQTDMIGMEMGKIELISENDRDDRGQFLRLSLKEKVGT